MLPDGDGCVWELTFCKPQHNWRRTNSTQGWESGALWSAGCDGKCEAAEGTRSGFGDRFISLCVRVLYMSPALSTQTIKLTDRQVKYPLIWINTVNMRHI